jgi:hypothetical protein
MKVVLASLSILNLAELRLRVEEYLTLRYQLQYGECVTTSRVTDVIACSRTRVLIGVAGSR